MKKDFVLVLDGDLNADWIKHANPDAQHRDLAASRAAILTARMRERVASLRAMRKKESRDRSDS